MEALCLFVAVRRECFCGSLISVHSVRKFCKYGELYSSELLLCAGGSKKLFASSWLSAVEVFLMNSVRRGRVTSPHHGLPSQLHVFAGFLFRIPKTGVSGISEYSNSLH